MIAPMARLVRTPRATMAPTAHLTSTSILVGTLFLPSLSRACCSSFASSGGMSVSSLRAECRLASRLSGVAPARGSG